MSNVPRSRRGEGAATVVVSGQFLVSTVPRSRRGGGGATVVVPSVGPKR